jgi:predicted GIY-YIG superfamily endonuclease
MEHTYYTYIMASASGTLYIGITNNIEVRVQQHKSGESEVSRLNTNATDWFISNVTARLGWRFVAKNN